MLSVVEHGLDPDIALVERIASTAIYAIHGTGAEHGGLYYDLIFASVSARVRETVVAAMKTHGYEFKDDFLRRYVAEGLAEHREEALQEGRREGRIELILKQLTARFGLLPEEIQTRVRGAKDAELDTLAERLLTAQTLNQILDSYLR